jgi:hypothetical protein
MTLQRLHSAEEVAEAIGETPNYVKAKCRAKQWPHRRGARGRVSFTADDYARVLELIAADVTAQESPRLSFAPRSRRGAA